MNLPFMLIFGIVVGLISFVVDRRAKGGLMGPIMLGILGYLLGGLMANLLFNISVLSNSNIFYYGLSIMGSFLLLFLSSKLRHDDPIQK